MKRPLIVAALAVSALALTACATMQPYGPAMGPTAQGYSEQRIESDRYRITYRGVGDVAVVSDYALLRAADLAQEQGYDWFEVTQRWIDGRPSAGGVRPSVSIGAGSSRYGRYRSSGVGVGVGLDLSGPQPTSTVIEVRMGRGAPPAGYDAYNAREVQAALRR
jgi:hypothetical protein